MYIARAKTRHADAPNACVQDQPRRAIDSAMLSELIRQAWVECQVAIQSGDKALVRRLHLVAKQSDFGVKYEDLRADFERHRSYFPNPVRINPEKIDPILVPIRSQRSLEGRLFKIARGYWSMPYSKGYGRRLRFLVLDQHHQAVIGIIGLQSPSADLACRDQYLGIAKEVRKLEIVNNTLDAYTVGATPTYAPLLAGKLIAGLLHSPVIGREYWRTYGNKRTTQLKKRIPQPLLAITTASAFGRSSIYNRLRQGNHLLARSIGFTKGFGTIHLEAVYPVIVEWLKQEKRHVPAGFGNGPKVRWQNIMRALVDLQIPRWYLEHGLRREVFLFERAENLIEVCANGEAPRFVSFDDSSWTSYWKERWCLPRARRDSSWFEFDSPEMLRAALERRQIY